MSLLALADNGLQMTGSVADISIPLQFDGPQPNHFGATPARAEPMRANGFTGDTREGGSCNAANLSLNPHCNGTHTECVGHLTTSRVSVNDVCPALPLLAGLITVETSRIRYDHAEANAIALDTLKPALEKLFALSQELTNTTPSALVIRTLPNTPDKKSKVYSSTADAAFVSVDAVEWLVTRGVDHLLVDLPSIDPHSDNGKLAAHRAMFGVPAYAECPHPEPSDARRSHATITEMVYVDDNIVDGLYLLNLQIPSFCLDAAPSRPLLYSLESA